MTVFRRAPDGLATRQRRESESSIESAGAYTFVVEAKADGRFGYTAVSDRLARALGLRPSEPRPNALFPAEVERRLWACCQWCVEAATDVEWDTELDLSDGRPWWRVLLMPLVDNETRIARIIGTAIDVTERKRTEQTLRRSRATFQAMIDAVDETIAMVSAEGVVLAINRFGARGFGLPPSGVVGRSLAELFDREQTDSLQHWIERVFSTGKRAQGELRWRERCLDISAHPVADRDGKPVAVSIFSRDITERKQNRGVVDHADPRRRAKPDRRHHHRSPGRHRIRQPAIRRSDRLER